MKEKLKYIIASGILILCAIATVLTVCLLPSGKSDGDIVLPLSVSAEDVTMFVGERKQLNIEVSNINSNISYTYIENDIIEIIEGEIIAHNSGSVVVQVEATYGKSTVSTTFTVTVVSAMYELTLIPIYNCEFANDILMVNGENPSFKISLLDSFGESVNSAVEVSLSNNATYSYKFGQYILKANENCTITFNFKDLSFKKNVSVVVK